MGMYGQIMAQAMARQKPEFGVLNEGDYYKDIDGYQILHCKQCGEKKQQIVFISTRSYAETQQEMEKYAIRHPNMSVAEVEKDVMSIMPPKDKRRDLGIVAVPCKCQRDYIDGRTRAEKDELRRATVRNNQSACFPSIKMQGITFDKYEDNKHIKAAKRYEKKFAEMKKEGKGLVLCGQSGAGKTIAAVCLANALLLREFRVVFKVQQEITFCTIEQRQELLKELTACSVLIIDDLNLATCNDYGKELLFYIVDKRTKIGKPTVITTNHTMSAIQNSDGADKRIFDRINESSLIVEDSSNNYRRTDNGAQ